MKLFRSSIALLVILCVFQASGQTELKRHSLSMGAGSLFQGTGDYITFAVSGRYSFYLKPNIGLSLQQMFNSAESFRSDGKFYSAKIWTTDLLFELHESDWISVSVGPSVRVLKSMEGEAYRLVEDEANPQNFGTPYTYPERRKDFALGLSSSINFRFINRESFYLSSRGILQCFYTNGDLAWGLLINTGFKI